MTRSLVVLLTATGLLVLALASPRAGGQTPVATGPSDHIRFDTADRCLACHNGLSTPTGEDVSIGSDWRASMMANAARDPYWQAAVRRETLDHPAAAAAIEDKCSTCHMPMARYNAVALGSTGRVFEHLPIRESDTRDDRLAADGVSCAVCHRIADERLGSPESFTGGFAIDAPPASGAPTVFGPFDIEDGLARIMESASGFRPEEAMHVQSSELCATCHTLYTHALDDQGNETGDELAEQVPYLEWRHSAYAETQSCQDCHLPVVDDPTRLTAVLGEPREGFSRHAFRGGNFFMLRMLNRYRDELGVEALPRELEAAVLRTIDHLRTSTASLAITELGVSGDRLRFTVAVENQAGHKFPTAYPSRRAWLHVTVHDSTGATVFESGAFRPDGSIAGNDNDASSDRFEPHHQEITDPEQVQIYESIMVGQDGAVTTGLLTGVRYIKDNRLLPRGFDRNTAPDDIAVIGTAVGDPDFVEGGDRVRYAVDVAGTPGPFRVEVALWFQPIGFRWARNLAPYDAFETRRFVRYYDALASASGLSLARATAQR